MKLDRNNYEEYFLMYADGELAPADRQAVEHFVKLHPDLADELEMLMQAVLDIDASITMPGKELLYKTMEWQEETLTPLQQDLLLYVDNELPAPQRMALESQLEHDKALQNDLDSLAKTKLPAEWVEMPEKEELYRHETKRRAIPIMVMRWMAAAAVVAGLGWFSLMVINGENTTRPPMQVALGDKPPKTNTGENIDKAGAAAEDGPAHTGLAANPQDPEAKENDTQFPAPVIAASSPKAGNGGVNSQNSMATTTVFTNQQQVEPVQIAMNPVAPAVDNSAANTTRPDNNDHPLELLAAQHGITKNDVVTTNPTMAATPNKSEVIQEFAAVSKDELLEEEEEPEYVNIAGARIKKQKVRGLFRSVTRTVSRAFDKSNVAQADVATLRK